MENLIQKIRNLKWNELDFNKNITVQGHDITLLEVNDNIAILRLIDRKVSEEGNISYNNRYQTLTELVFPTNFSIEKIVTNELKLRQYRNLNNVFHFNHNNIQRIEITDNIDDYEIANNSLQINPNSLINIIEKYNQIYEDAKKYKEKYVLYKLNEFNRSRFGIEKKRKTLTNRGDFSFVVECFNLPTKRKKSDFLKYLNENDLISLQELILKLIQKEVFDSKFLLKLNDYFIKERLEDIIELGREILSLKSSNIRTKTAIKTIKKVETDGRKIKQLENVWQKYFEKYLSFLIFSYREIYPKIELKVELRKKYPDFIGINHYGGVDIIEIKTHLKNALTKDKSHDNYAFSSEMSKAIIQTINYMDALIQEKVKKKIIKEDIKGKILKGNIYRPREIIIISSYNNLVKGVKKGDSEFKKVERDFTKLRNGLHNISIITFDELLNMAENYKDNIIK